MGDWSWEGLFYRGRRGKPREGGGDGLNGTMDGNIGFGNLLLVFRNHYRLLGEIYRYLGDVEWCWGN
jgi:hypothetical protein